MRLSTVWRAYEKASYERDCILQRLHFKEHAVEELPHLIGERHRMGRVMTACAKRLDRRLAELD